MDMERNYINSRLLLDVIEKTENEFIHFASLRNIVYGIEFRQNNVLAVGMMVRFLSSDDSIHQGWIYRGEDDRQDNFDIFDEESGDIVKVCRRDLIPLSEYKFAKMSMAFDGEY